MGAAEVWSPFVQTLRRQECGPALSRCDGGQTVTGGEEVLYEGDARDPVVFGSGRALVGGHGFAGELDPSASDLETAPDVGTHLRVTATSARG